MNKKEKLNRLLAEAEFIDYELSVICSGEKRSSIDKEKFIKDIIEYGEYDSIDEEMIPILIELNKKGYYTTMCCSGHLEQIKDIGRYGAYLDFKRPYKLNPPLFNIEKKSNGKYSEILNDKCYRWNGDTKGSIEEKENDRKKLMNELLEWAKGLDKCDWVEKEYAKDGWVYLDGVKTFQYEE